MGFLGDLWNWLFGKKNLIVRPPGSPPTASELEAAQRDARHVARELELAQHAARLAAERGFAERAARLAARHVEIVAKEAEEKRLEALVELSERGPGWAAELAAEKERLVLIAAEEREGEKEDRRRYHYRMEEKDRAESKASLPRKRSF